MRRELEDLEHAAARHTDPANLAGRLVCIHAEERPHSVRRRVGHTHERAAEHVRIEADGPVEVGHGDAGVAERAGLHSSVSLMWSATLNA